jgi:hypothetical protein
VNERADETAPLLLALNPVHLIPMNQELRF